MDDDNDFKYVDNRYVPAHSFGHGAIDGNQTFSVPIEDSVYEYNSALTFDASSIQAISSISTRTSASTGSIE